MGFPGGAAAAAAKSLQLCSTLCDPIDGSPPGSPVPRILQARTLEWVASFLQCMKVKSESEVAQSCPTLKNLPDNAKDEDLIPGLGRSPGGGHDKPLQYSCLESPWTEEPGRLQSMGSQRIEHDWAHSHIQILHRIFFFSTFLLESTLFIQSQITYLSTLGHSHFPSWNPSLHASGT